MALDNERHTQTGINTGNATPNTLPMQAETQKSARKKTPMPLSKRLYHLTKLLWYPLLSAVVARHEMHTAQEKTLAESARKWSGYTGEVLAQLGFSPDAKIIELELIDHLETRYEALLAEGHTPEDARAESIAAMGDARETGKALCAVHAPLLSWAFWLLRRCAFLLALALLWHGISACHSAITLYYTEPYYDRAEGTVIETIDLHAVQTESYCYRYQFDEVCYYDDGYIELRYRIYYNPFSRAIRWMDTPSLLAFDEQGEELSSLGGSGGTSGGWFYTAQIAAHFTEDVQPRFLFIWTNYKTDDGVLIDLETGNVIV